MKIQYKQKTRMLFKGIACIAVMMACLVTFTNPAVSRGQESVSSRGIEWVEISGTVRNDEGVSLCAMVLANGQYTFSDSTTGEYYLRVPLNDNGEISILSFVDGFAPYSHTIIPSETPSESVISFDITVPSVGDEPEITLTNEISAAETNPGWVRITGQISFENETPLCAMVLANGQYMFTCDPVGEYDMEVPVNDNGRIVIFGFADGFKPFKQIVVPETELAEYTAMPIIPLETSDIEASALLWLDDIGLYLVISDETPDNEPLLFLMDKYGTIIKETSVQGLKKIKDMESVAMAEDGTVYIASSSSLSKDGDLDKSRRLLVSVKREQDEFSLMQKIDLYTLLEDAAFSENESDWAEFILDAIDDESVDIEGMFCRAGALYLGFKSPLKSGNSVILKIDDIDDVFDNEEIDSEQVSIWNTVFLKPDGSAQESISDLFYHNGTLYIIGTLTGSKSGSLWKLDEISGNLTRIAAFDGLQPEGIGAGYENDNVIYSLMISFDQGDGNASQFAYVSVIL
ncbi:MAG: hypothetical protein GY749_14265 [Desulfobacteraceae bacterium]|nr:hypothetical protein [Desulfobacteraceae bacterium]